MEERETEHPEVTPVGALERLRARSESSRLSLVLTLSLGLIVLALLGGLVIRFVSGTDNAPPVPQVEL